MKMSNLVLVFTLGLASLYLTLANDSQCKFPAQWQSNIYFDFGMMLAVQGQTNASGVFYYDYTNRQTRLDIAGTFTQDHHYNVPMYYTIIWQFNEVRPLFVSWDCTYGQCRRLVNGFEFSSTKNAREKLHFTKCDCYAFFLFVVPCGENYSMTMCI